MSGTTHFDPTGDLVRRPVLIEASAGTGKTYGITDLVLRLVADGELRLPEILVVTFTKAATSELRDRVRARLVTAVGSLEKAVSEQTWAPDEDDDALIAWLVREGREQGGDVLVSRLEALRTAREEFDDATISTIHGFCQETLRRSAFETGIDFGAELVEDISGLVEEVTHDYAVRELRGADDGWYRYLQAQKVSHATLRRIAERVEKEPHLRVVPDDMPGVEPRALWEETLGEFRDAWERGADELIAWLEQVCADKLVTSRYQPDKIAERRAAVDDWAAAGDRSTPKTVTEAIEYLGRTEVEGRLRKDRALPVPAPPLLDACAELRRRLAAPATLVKTRFAAHARDEISRRKRARNILSFDDLLRSLADALAAPDVGGALRETVRARFGAALIDEFQDTDPIQWAIFHAVFGEDAWLHLIGDPKQAIYAFRGADVHTYLRARDDHVDPGDQLTLERNWRSDRRFVEALNSLLDRPGVFGTEAIDYVAVRAADRNDDDRLTHPDGPGPTLVIRHLTRPAIDESADPAEVLTKKKVGPVIPTLVAGEIVDFLGSGAQIVDATTKEWRPVEPRDIAVLTRKNSQATEVQESLLAAGIPAVTTGGGNVLASSEARLLQRFLDAVLRPGSDRDVRSALATPLLGVDAPTLVEMNEREWEQWLEALSGWSSAWRESGVARMIQRAFTEHGVAERILRRPDGERRITNILHLVELLHEAETTGRLGPTALAAWLRTQRHEEQESQEREIRLESDEEAVQVVTMHRSKGLEFPVVWCPYLWDGRFRDGTTDLRLHDPETGDLILDLHTDATFEPTARHGRYVNLETWQENLRLMYVALTRARHRCVVYWGAITDSGTSPLAHVLHDVGRDTDEDGHPTFPTTSIDLTDEEIDERLRALAERSEGTIGVEAASRPTAEPEWVRPEREEVPLRAREYRRTQDLDTVWGRTSFTALTRRAHEERPTEPSPAAEGRERDERTAGGAAAPVVVPDDAPQVPLAGFVRGAEAGIFLHDVLEHLDFTAGRTPGAFEATVEERLGRHAVGDVDVAALAAALRDVVTTPLGALAGEARLADTGPRDRLDELTFDLALAGGYTPATPTATVTLPAIATVLERHAGESAAPVAEYAQRLRGLPEREARGFLNGAIDLVLRLGDGERPRYFVVDHKSNWLGDRETGRLTVHHHAPGVLRTVMEREHYLLQYHLYLVALHRFLRWRLGDDYDYERDVGGVLYLFVRGMLGPATPADAGQTYGVYADRPSAALVHDLDMLLATGEVPR